MKWLVVVLVLLNLAAWLLGKRIDPVAQQSVSADQIETINAAQMSVIQPSQEMARREANDALALEEERLTQIKLDERGRVLMAPNESERVARPPAIVALDRSGPEKHPKPVARPVEQAKIATEKPAMPTPEPVTPVSAVVAKACYRLGPFTSQISLASARRALEMGGVNYSVDENGKAKKIKGVRVYLGTPASKAALQTEVKRLEKMKIEHFVISLNGSPLVQLGYFSGLSRAKAYQKTLMEKGIDAKTDTIYHEARISSWLDVQMVSKDLIKALKLPNGIGVKDQACR